MADIDHDWQVFHTHEFGLRRRLRRRPEDISSALRTEFDALVDPHAYSQRLIDIANARRQASEHFQEVELIAQIKTENPDEPWHQRDINALGRSNRSQINLSNALLRFTREQKRIRPSGISNADATSRDFTKGLIREVEEKMRYINDLWLQARASIRAAQDRARADAADAECGHHEAELINGEGAADEIDRDPVRAQQDPESSGSPPRAIGQRKRSRKSDSDLASDEDQRPRKASRPGNSPIAEEPLSSNGMPLANVAPPLEHGLDPVEDFETRWQAFLEALTEQDRPGWQKLYSRARRVVDANLAALHSKSASPDAMADFRITVNKALEDVFGRIWEEHVDMIRADEDGLYQAVDLEYAQLAKEAIMHRAQQGQSPILPPALKEVLQLDPSIDEEAREAQTRKETAKAIASDLVYEESQEQAGQWNYLSHVGRGANGDAQLWTGIRSDEHGMVVERVVVKIFSIEATWGWNSMWVSNSFTGDDNWLRERAMHAQLSAIGSANGIVQYRGASSETKGKWNQRLYMEYCAHGDLADLLCTHGKSDGFSPQLDDNYEQIPKVPIPVRALWTFFKDLATAACVMKSGYNPLDEDVSAPLYWEEIIHRDLKPGNVFLTAPLANTGRGIPLCKVGDFGLAVPRHYEPLPNPERMCSAGSLGWKAPEYNAYAEDLGIDYELSSATNIWAIGRIMLALMELTATRPPTIRYDDDGGGQVIVEAKDELVSMYGEELYNLVEKCLDPLPDDRITARQLLRKIDRQLSNPLVTLPLELREGDVLDYKQDMRWAT